MNRNIFKTQRYHEDRPSQAAYKDLVSGDDHPTRISNSKRLGHNKAGTRVKAGPIRRLFRKHVGRPWNLIFSEIKPLTRNKNFKLDWYVELNPVMVDGVAHRWGDGGLEEGLRVPTPIRRNFYVNPVTGLLCEVKEGKRKKYTRKRELSYHALESRPGVLYFKKLVDIDIGSVWFVQSVALLPKPDIFAPKAAWVEYENAVSDAVHEFGMAVKLVGKQRQLGKKDIKWLEAELAKKK